MEQLTIERREKIVRLRAKKETENKLRVSVGGKWDTAALVGVANKNKVGVALYIYIYNYIYRKLFWLLFGK